MPNNHSRCQRVLVPWLPTMALFTSTRLPFTNDFTNEFGFHSQQINWLVSLNLSDFMFFLFCFGWIANRPKGILADLRPKIAHELGMWLVKTYRRLCSIRLIVRGLENLPAGSKILAANHPNCSDAFLLSLLFDGRIRILAQASQFRQPLLGWIFTHTGQIPVHKGYGQEAFREACGALTLGDSLLIFPEGRLNPDHQEIKINTGAVRMALLSGAPIIPVGVHVPSENTVNLDRFKSHSQDKKLWQVRGNLYVNFGEAWFPSEGVVDGENPNQIHALTDCLMEKIHDLEDQARKDSSDENSNTYPVLPAHDQRGSDFFLPPGGITR